MSRFNNALKAAARRVINAAGEPVLVSKKNGHKLPDVWVHIQTDAEFTNDETKTVDYRTEVEVMKDDVLKLSRGDEIVTEDERLFRVEEKLQDDGITIRAVLLELE